MTRRLAFFALAGLLSAVPAAAQTVDADRGARLAAVLPASAAAAVRARAAEAHRLGLPGDAIVLRALELAAKGAEAGDVVRRVEALGRRLALAQLALRQAGHPPPTDEELVAGADAIASGLTPAQLRALVGPGVTAEPLARRLIVITGLLDRGVPADAAIANVAARLAAPGVPRHAAPAAIGTDAPPPLVPTVTGRSRRDRTHPPQPRRSPGPRVTA
jgi:hypothetical protein